MNCPNCEKLILKNTKFCADCGTANPEFQTSDGRIDKLEKEIVELKKRVPAAAKTERDEEESI